MSPEEIDALKSKVDVVVDFLHQQGVPYFLLVGVPGTDEFIERDNIPDGDERSESVAEFRDVANRALDNLMVSR